MACHHYQIKVSGKVQGVWFRKHTQAQARSLNIKGFVKNEPDGSVYIEAESHEPTKLNAFIKWLYEGSPLSKVNTVEILEDSPCHDFEGFEILR